MAKIDVTLIEGYDKMTAEEKLKALEALELPAPDYTGYIKKETFDKTASELAGLKKQLREKLTEEEAAKLREKEEREALEAKYNKLLRESEIAKHKAKLIGLGYEEELAEETATAIADGDSEKVFVNQKKHLTAFEKKIKADVLKDTPKPPKGGEPSAMTLDKFRKLSPMERLKYSQEHPEEYKELYGVTQ